MCPSQSAPDGRTPKAFPTESGERWTGAVHKGTGGSGILLGAVLRQPRVAGIVMHNGDEICKSKHIPAILDERTWRALVAKLESKAALTRGPGGGARRGALTSGQESPARCEIRDGPLTSSDLGGATEQVRYYERLNGHVSIREDLVNREVLQRAAVAAAIHGVRILPGAVGPDTSLDEARLSEVEANLAIWREL